MSLSQESHILYIQSLSDNLKDNIKRNKPIDFFKHGGVKYDALCGKYYILVAASKADGRLGQIKKLRNGK